MTKIIIEVSARHVHPSKKDFQKLFKKAEPTFWKKLSQSTDYAAKETVVLQNKKKMFENVRVVGPCRANTQVEISATDAYYLGIGAKVRLSGDVKGTAGAKLIGKAGSINLKQGVIIAKRHIHCDPKTAKKIGLKNNQKASVKVGGPRGLIFTDVIVRVGQGYAFRLHLDTDEANAAGIKNGDKGEII